MYCRVPAHWPQAPGAAPDVAVEEVVEEEAAPSSGAPWILVVALLFMLARRER